MSIKIPKVAVIGAGYWGKNLVRNFHDLQALKWVCDPREEILRAAEQTYGVRTSSELAPILADGETDAVVIAAPAVQHFELAKKSLLAGKDVYSEKPLALHASEGQELVDLASSRKRILMVGHILEYHPAIVKLKELIRSGELGRIQYIYSSRLNLGKLRTEENILWSFAPHDISAILSLLGEMPTRTSANGGNYVSPNNYDTTLTTCEFPSGAKAHIFVSWLHPFKEQKLTIVGGKKMAVFDDVSRDKKLVVYDHRINWIDRVPVAQKDDGQVIEIAKDEPLRIECEHFLECVLTRKQPRTDGQSALQVLQVLEACEQSLKQGSKPVELTSSKAKYFVHPTAVVDDGARIGEGTKVWHFSHVMSDSTVGERCNFGQNVVISPDVVIGNNVKIQNNVSVYTGVILEDDVFCGPSMVFTNVVNPRSHILRRNEYRRTLVRQGASIGANATIVCGVTLGRYSFIGAGSTVIRDVPDYALMVGNPAKQKGWMCYCGVKLPETGSERTCQACSRKYLVENGICKDITETEQKVAA